MLWLVDQQANMLAHLLRGHGGRDVVGLDELAQADQADGLHAGTAAAATAAQSRERSESGHYFSAHV